MATNKFISMKLPTRKAARKNAVGPIRVLEPVPNVVPVLADEDDEDRHERRTEGVKVLGRHLVPLPTGRDALPIRVPEASQRARAEGARKELHAEESEDEHREDQQEREVAGGHERSADREEDLAQALEGARELERTEDSKHA